MSFECINPDVRGWISEITASSPEEIEALDFGGWVGYAEMCEARLHWNCCPSCRCEFPNLLNITAQAGPRYEKSFAADLSGFRQGFLDRKNSLLQSGRDDAYSKLIALLASAEFDVHDSLRRVLNVTQELRRGMPIEFDPYKREILSHCREFVTSLDLDVQQFVIASTLCFELLRPMWEKVGHPPRIDPRTPEQIGPDVEAVLAALAKAKPTSPRIM